MKRRAFLSRLAPALGAPFMLAGIPMRAHARSPRLDALTAALAATDRVLVLVQLSGGNDGLNMVVPVDQFGAYQAARANIALPERSLLPLRTGLGLHPIMTDLHALHGEGRLVTIQNVSYPNPNQSHFRATDIWMSGSDYNEYLASGWIGRALDVSFPGYPDGYPNAAMPDPPAIQIGAVLSLLMQGPAELMGIAIQDPQSFYDLVNGKFGGGDDTPPNTPAGRELTYIRQVQAESQAYSTVIKQAADAARNLATYPTPDTNDRAPLSEQLKIVARLVAGGLKTRVYIVTLGGFDTHDNQVDASDATIGSHATLLRRLSQAIGAFQNDLALLGIADRVVGMTFSEFGRRVTSNTGRGTDHGTAAPMFVFGSMVQPGVLGANPDLANLDKNNLRMEFDYRQIYASLLRQWFGLGAGDSTAVLGGSFTELPIIRSGATGVDATVALDFSLAQNHPNPFTDATAITWTQSHDAEVHLAVYDARGREVATLVHTRHAAGEHTLRFAADGLPAGTYALRLRAGRTQAVRMMTRVR
jgi:uncharacterized protein (DUF1501 family)